MADVQQFAFKNVLDGKPFSDVPLCPPRAAEALFAWQRKHPPQAHEDGDSAAVAFYEIASTICAIVLRRLDPSVKDEAIAGDENEADVIRLFQHIRAANPSLFGPVEGQVPA
ncbi:MAG: hypothetical protein ACYC2H_07260 [Thermoplasmatota archaeon]